MEFAFGPRVYTMFIYLSDVESGGSTAFPSLGIAVEPKKGKALLWPSVLDKDTMKMDIRTMHEAQPVRVGVKHAANAWLHQRDFRTPHSKGCAP